MAQPKSSLNLSTKVFLVLLRLVIGWHFVFEAAEKFKGDSWSAEPYLREASGPLGPMFRWMAGDPVKDRLTPLPVPAGTNPLEAKLHDRFPPALAAEWDAYHDAFVRRYVDEAQQRQLAQVDREAKDGQALPPEGVVAVKGAIKQQYDQQRAEIDTAYLQLKDNYVSWLEQGKKPVTWTSPYGPPVTAERTVAERIALYEEKQEQARKFQENDYAASKNTFNEDKAKAELLAMKAEANRTRAELRADLNAKTAAMKDTLLDKLTPFQKEGPPLSAAETRPGVLAMSRLDWINESVRWGLLVVGFCLLLGLCSRPACVAGAAFLLMFYLAMPALPWLPEPPKGEGHYVFINKNLIEMVALLALATVPTGRWLGLDALLQFLLPSRWRAAKPGPTPVTLDVPPAEKLREARGRYPEPRTR